MAADDRAQSEVIGTILLVGVVVITVTTAGAFYLSNLSDSETGPTTDFNATVTTSSVNITHLGGDSIARDELTVIVRNNSNTQQFSVADGTLTNSDADEQFELGERWDTSSISLPAGETVRILVVHDPSNTLLYDGRKRVDA